MDPVDELARGRDACAREAWAEAHASLLAADESAPLDPDDLEQLASSAYMLGRLDGYLGCLERAYSGYLKAGEAVRAVRCAFWVGVTRAQRGEVGAAGGWFGRAQRLLDQAGSDRVEAGYLLLPRVFRHEGKGDLEAAAAIAAEAAATGERFADPDLFALAAHEQGHLLIRLGRLPDGLALLDEAMVAATAEELSPIVCGIVYCGSILACRDAYELRRTREWTAALSAWCGRQPDLVAFTGRCLVHRAEILRLQGAWNEALHEARRAVERCLGGENPAAAGEAWYEQGEVHRLRGDFRASEDAYRRASATGRDPQPGLALLRLARGDTKAAAAAIRRVAAEPADPPRRAGVLPAFVEIMLALDDVDAAVEACDELDSLDQVDEGMLGAFAAQARGAVELARGDARAALAPLRRAAEAWHRLGAPYERARVRELMGRACVELGDEDSARLELEAAHDVFATLGAATDLARVGLLRELAAFDTHGLTPRELDVLRLVATGKSNRAIAEALVISEHTVARHLQNIFRKLDLSSRTAASAYAFEHRLV